MAKWISGAACAAAVMSMTLAAAQPSAAQAAQSPQTKTPPTPTSRAMATLSGCVVRDAANAGQPTILSNGIAYRLTGRPAAELEQVMGKKVEVTGAMTTGAPAPRPPEQRTHRRRRRQMSLSRPKV